jgi:hypothetical protein
MGTAIMYLRRTASGAPRFKVLLLPCSLALYPPPHVCALLLSTPEFPRGGAASQGRRPFAPRLRPLALRLALPPISHLPLSVLAAPLGGAAAAEGQDTLNALKMDCRSCGFDRARSRPAKIFEDAKKAAHYPKTRPSLRCLVTAGRFVVPRGPHRAQLDKADAVCAEADAARPDGVFCHAAPRLSVPCTPHPPVSFCAGTASKPVGGAAAEEGRDTCSALGSDEAGNGDVGKWTHAAIARA